MSVKDIELPRIYVPLGETLRTTVGAVKAVKDDPKENNCPCCVFQYSGECDMLACQWIDREDKTDVHFVEVKGGEV